MRYIVVHAAATPPSLDIDAAWIDKIHKERGFRKIGYHYVIKRNGVVEKGREESEMGAHVKGFNRDSLGICMVGGLKEGTQIPEDNFTLEQWQSLEQILLRLHMKYPEAEFKGHNEFPNHHSRGCPCFDSKEYFQQLMVKWGETPLHLPPDPDTIWTVEEGKYPSWDELMKLMSE